MFKKVLLFVILLGILMGWSICDEKDDEEPILQVVKNDEIDNTHDLQDSVKENLEERDGVIDDQENSNNIQPKSEIIKNRITDAVINRIRKLGKELTSPEENEGIVKEFEDNVLERMDELSIQDIVDLLSEVISKDEEIKQMISEIYESGVSDGDLIEMLKIDGKFILGRIKETSDGLTREKETPDEHMVHLDVRSVYSDQTDLSELCPSELNEPTDIDEDREHAQLSLEEISQIDSVLIQAGFNTRALPESSQLSVAFEWALNDTFYSNYSILLYRLIFQDELVPRNLTLALQLATFLADKGIASGQNALAYIHKTGYSLFNTSSVNNTKPNAQIALTYYTFSALGGNIFSEMAMAYRHQSGVGVTASCKLSLVYYQRVARKMLKQIGLSGGPALYKNRLSDIMEDSGDKVTNGDLIDYFEMLAHKGEATYSMILGQLFLQGTKGAGRNIDTAIRFFELAARDNNDNALVMLGSIFADCTLKGVTDYNQAISYLNRAIELGNVGAKTVLGYLYLVGLGVKQDYKRAKLLIEPGAKKNDHDAALYLGIMMYYGLGIQRNKDQAFRYFVKGSESGNLLAIYFLAKANADQAKTCPSAVKLYKGMVERGFWSHLLMVAYRSFNDKEYTRAYLIYSFLGEMGYEVAQSNTAYILEKFRNEIFPQFDDSQFRAYHHWSRSAEQGSSQSRIRLGDYNYYGIGRPVDYDIAVNEYKHAAKDQDAQGKFNLGFMYQRGLGVPKDFPLAKRNYDECLNLEGDAYIAVQLSLLHLVVMSQFDWVTSSINLPFSFNPLTFLLSFIVNWDIYLITLLVMALGLVYLMYKQHLAENT